MTVIGLNFPTDIAWERVCVTEDMIDEHACDSDTPPKWQTSIAVFRYIPEAEYQNYPKRRIIYYKVVCTITSYQPHDDEIEGSIDWEKLSAKDILDFQQKLKSFLPCNGAIIQVTVVPPVGVTAAKTDYPYFMDFQPKQRILYEQASDTGERMSRSLENLSVSKGAGTSHSVEALDVDQGGSSDLAINAGGGGGKVGHSTSGMWGTKRLSKDDQTNLQTSDSSRENRETTSHTTDLTQMYNLFQAYHQGTNRAMFYLAPRPHILEEPSGFITGPRIIDGIQELFVIVNQPAEQGDPCLAVRVDTAHLTKIDKYDYDNSQPTKLLDLEIKADAPAKDQPDLQGAPSPDVYYDCFRATVRAEASSTAPDGYHINTVIDVFAPQVQNGLLPDPDYSADNKTVTIRGEAYGDACFRNSAGDGAEEAIDVFTGKWLVDIFSGDSAQAYPKVKNTTPGYVRRQVQVSFLSDAKTKLVSSTPALLVTSTGLCCCQKLEQGYSYAQKAVGMEPLGADDLFDRIRSIGVARSEQAAVPNNPVDIAVAQRMTARQANYLQELITSVAKRISSTIGAPNTLVGLDRAYLMHRLVAARVVKADLLTQKANGTRELARHDLGELAKLTGQSAAESVTRLDVARSSEALLSKALGVHPKEATRLRLIALGLPVRQTLDGSSAG